MTLNDIDLNNFPKHIGIILDGNRRWAKLNNLPPTNGHIKGAENLEEMSRFANKIGLEYLTVYSFSTENWKRSKEEVSALMALLKLYLDKFLKTINKENIRIKVLGDISKLQKSLQTSINKAIEISSKNTGLTLNLAFNYGGRDEIVKATKKIAENVKNGILDINDITENTISENIYTAGMPDPDLIIRTSGEQRLSNFLTWQSVYSEFYFPQKHWPEFKEEDLLIAIKEYQKRTRKFGAK